MQQFTDKFKDPKLLSLVTIQLLQSFTFYGVRSLLVLYLTKNFFFSDQNALSLYGNIMALLYLTPLLGGILLDRYLKPSLVLFLGILLTQFGTLLMVFPNKESFFLGLAILVMGQGFFKPIIPFLLDYFYKDQNSAREARYTVYYVMLNIGACLSPFLCGFVSKLYGMSYAFMIVSTGSLIAFYLAFKLMRKEILSPLTLRESSSSLLYILPSIGVLFILLSNPHWIDFLLVALFPMVLGYLAYKYFLSSEKRNMRNIIICLLAFCFFVTLFEQVGGSMILFMERFVNRDMFGISDIPASTFLGLNPLFLILSSGIVAKVGQSLEERELRLSSFIRIGIGFLFISLGFLIVWKLAGLYAFRGKLNALWILITLFLHSLGELFIVPTTLSLITRLAPLKEKGLYLGLWGISVAYGHFLASFMGRLVMSSESNDPLNATNYQHIFLWATTISFCLCLILLLLEQLKRQTRREG
ncbi:MAG: oligopeptide:H+ symporter [Candidatus Paracaedibacteraceae bacterium]|nr:oligopeptide:H+ symporter [Candidatus Paracaedibacteraceae bacterium]